MKKNLYDLLKQIMKENEWNCWYDWLIKSESKYFPLDFDLF